MRLATLSLSHPSYLSIPACSFQVIPGIKEDGSALGGDKLKSDKIEGPRNSLGANSSQLDNEDGDPCWGMSSDRYCHSLITNIEDVRAMKGLRLPSKCITPLQCGYKPELDNTCELKADGVQFHQGFEICMVDILLETSIMSSYLAMPR